MTIPQRSGAVDRFFGLTAMNDGTSGSHPAGSRGEKVGNCSFIGIESHRRAIGNESIMEASCRLVNVVPGNTSAPVRERSTGNVWNAMHLKGRDSKGRC